MKDKELAKALEAVLEAGEHLKDVRSTAEYRHAVLWWDRAAETARGMLKVRQVRDERVKKNHISRKSQ